MAVEILNECPTQENIQEIMSPEGKTYHFDSTEIVAVDAQSRCPADEYGPKTPLVWIEVDGEPVFLPPGRHISIQLWGGVTVGLHSRVSQ